MIPRLITTAVKLFLIYLTWSVTYPQACLQASTEPTFLEKPALVLGQGEQRILKIPKLYKYSLGSPVIRALPLPRALSKTLPAQSESILIKGVTPGNGDLWVWKQDGSSEHRTIRVEKLISDRKNLGLERALGQLEEVEVIPTGRGALLRGKVYTLREAFRIKALLQTYSTEIYDETEPSPEFLGLSLDEIHQWIKKSKYSSQLRVEQIGQNLWVRGNIENPRELGPLEKQMKALFPSVMTEIEALPDHSPTVYFRVFLLELKRNQFHNLGFSWPASVPGAFQVTSGAVQELLQIDIALQQLEGNGNAKILSNPELVVRAPGEAELFAGGELPIQLQTKFFSNVSWKNYGLTLRLKVTHTAGDRVRLDIFTEVSHLSSPPSKENIPSIQSNRIKTQVDARFGVPLLLSGLLQQGMREEAKGLPFLRKIPVLGPLFGSEDYLNERSELVAILYPHSSPPAVPAAEKVKSFYPKGSLPPPRNWVDPEDAQTLRNSEDYPWNAFN